MNTKSIGLKVLGLLCSLHFASATATLNLQSGDSATIDANTNTYVTCGGGGNGGISCTEGCQKWYDLNTYVNGQWQNVATCAFQTTCAVSNGCVKETTCAQFQTINTYINSQWQDVVSCAGTQSKTTCH